MWNFFKRKSIQNLNIKISDIPQIVGTIKDPSDNNQITEYLWDVNYLRAGDTPFYADGSHWHPPVEDMFYRVNNLGIPGEDFVEGAPALALGCSVTAGCGLWHKWTWPYILSKELGYPINVLANPGKGIAYCLDSFYKYIDLYGKPEKVFLLSPDIFRLKVMEIDPISKDNYVFNTKSFSWFTDFKDYSTNVNLGPHTYRGMYGKRYSYPIESGILQNVSELCRIESLCRNMGIELKVSSWDMITNEVLKLCISDEALCNDIYKSESEVVKTIEDFDSLDELESYMNTVHWFVDKIDNENCHLHHPMSGHNYWSIAADKSHPGIHAQLHYAERFLKRPISERVLSIISEPLPDVKVVRKPSNERGK